MRAIARDGDTVGPGGKIISKARNVFIGGKKVAIEDSPVTPHDKDPTHIATMKATSTVFVNGKRVCRDGDKATCSHAVKSSQSRVQAG
jgi:uncharacterized Zn-binding protein involved in type VI secretion